MQKTLTAIINIGVLTNIIYGADFEMIYNQCGPGWQSRLPPISPMVVRRSFFLLQIEIFLALFSKIIFNFLNNESLGIENQPQEPFSMKET